MSGYTIRNIPNTANLRACFKAMAGGMPYRPRGRGCPEGTRWAEVAFGTPLRNAPKFTAYYGRAPYQYFEFTGRWLHGRPVVRRLP